MGGALARHLVETGWRVIIDGRDARRLAAAATELGGAAGEVQAVAGDVTDPAHRRDLATAVAAAGRLDLLVHNASELGPSPLPALLDHPLDDLQRVFAVNVLAPIALTQALQPWLSMTATLISISSDAAVEPYEHWGGYGASKAALDHAFAVLAAEHPAWRVYRVDPGDLRTEMHQAAFPGEDISDRPLPESRIPAFTRLLGGDLPSGRYTAADLLPEEVTS